MRTVETLLLRRSGSRPVITGRAMQRARATGIEQRMRSRMSCSSFRRLVFFRRTASSRCIAPQGTILNLLRWKRWMMTGMATAAMPAIRAALRKVMGLPSHPQREVLGQRLRVGLVRHHRDQVDLVAVAALLELRAELLEVLQVGRAQVVRVHQVLLPVGLEAVEAGPLA